MPVEAQACGAAVIAFGRGGATQTVIPPERRREPTGLWFTEPTVEALTEALTAFEKRRSAFSPSAARRQALRFNAAALRRGTVRLSRQCVATEHRRRAPRGLTISGEENPAKAPYNDEERSLRHARDP